MTTTQNWVRRFAKLVNEHLGLVVAAVGSVIVATRLLAFASYRIDVALLILGSSDPAKVVLGTVMTVLPTVAGFLALMLWVLVAAGGVTDARKGPIVFAATFLGVFGALFASLAIVGVFAVLMLALRFYPRRLVRNKPAPGPTTDTSADTTTSFSYAFLGLVAFGIVAAIASPVPTEVVGVKDVGRVTARVLNGEEAWVTLVTSGGDAPAVIYVRQGDITYRSVCQYDSSWWSQPVVELIAPSRFPPCDSVD